MKNLPAHLFHQTLTICIFGLPNTRYTTAIMKSLLKKTLVIERIQREVDLVNKELGDHEKNKKI